MNFTINPEVITPVLKLCAKISNPNGFKPVFGYIKILADKNKVVTLSVMDSSIQFSGRVEASDVLKPGEAIVEADRFFHIFKTRVGGSKVEVKKEENFLTFKQKEFRAKLSLLKDDEFPEFNFNINHSYSMEISAELLRNISRCASVVDSKSKGKFNGLLFDFGRKNELWVCGFSDHLVYVFKTGVEKHGGFRCVLDSSCLSLLSSYVGNSSVRLFLDLNKSRAVFSNDTMSMMVSFMEDKYPHGYVEFLGLNDMDNGKFWMNKLGPRDDAGNIKIIESIQREIIEFDRENFIRALVSAASVLDGGGIVEMIREEATSKGDGIAEFVGYNHKTNAKASEKILSKDNLKEKFSIGLSSEKVLSVVSSFSSDIFRIHVLDAKQPIVIVEDKEPNFVAISLSMVI
jgi:DNA polymerase III sliding clamp (beta) subunit (PCNA family)